MSAIASFVESEVTKEYLCKFWSDVDDFRTNIFQKYLRMISTNRTYLMILLQLSQASEKERISRDQEKEIIERYNCSSVIICEMIKKIQDFYFEKLRCYVKDPVFSSNIWNNGEQYNTTLWWRKMCRGNNHTECALQHAYKTSLYNVLPACIPDLHAGIISFDRITGRLIDNRQNGVLVLAISLSRIKNSIKVYFCPDVISDIKESLNRLDVIANGVYTPFDKTRT
ncbi:hypothetical protein HELRODRAFT_174678 [Helobdella robusta]|uniref:Uncharacterized protein n=1 Tax=Helobdella robusta TaxID=6412 RepID=T1F8D1_HELRO|nr:hypothetical protein HELRODRAFT_174678 [Helobdella robusta]ESO01707.1 hypothetical protein HELRODRAFT_174678 [Helobdella robusta]